MMLNRYFILGIMIMTLSYATFFVCDKDTALMLGKEDSFFENLGALFFLLSSLCFAYSFKIHKKWVFLLLSFLFFIAAGEEISWGQRFFKITPPEAIKIMNVQGEINIHNLELFNRTQLSGNRKTFKELIFKPDIDRLFTLFWLLWCFLLPLINLYKISINRIINKMHIQIPMVTLGIGIIFPINYLLSKILCVLMSKEISPPIIEAKEWVFAFLFFLISIELFKRKSDELF